MASIFTKIINGDIPSHKIGETEKYYAFLDIRPRTKGHTLVIPKKEIDYIFQLDDDLLSGLIVYAKKVASAIEKEVDCERVGVAVVGLEVPHAHVHLMPINAISDFGFHNKPLDMSDDEMKELADKISSHLS